MKKFLLMALGLCIVGIGYAAEQKVELNPNCGDSVEIKAKPKHGYHFMYWKETGVTDSVIKWEVHEDVTLHAKFAKDTFYIVFKDHDDKELEKDTIEWNDPVLFHGETPFWDGGRQYTYTFKGWNPDLADGTLADIDEVNFGDQKTDRYHTHTYVAQYDQKVNTYRIEFRNYNDTLFAVDSVNYDSIPAHPAVEPTKDSTDTYAYHFIGWDDENGNFHPKDQPLPSVVFDTIYTAHFDSTFLEYTVYVAPNDVNYGSAEIILKDETGAITTHSEHKFHYDTLVTVLAEEYTCYEFVGWYLTSDVDPDTKQPKADASVLSTDLQYTFNMPADYNYRLTAVYKRIKYKITVISDDDAQGTVDAKITDTPDPYVDPKGN